MSESSTSLVVAQPSESASLMQVIAKLSLAKDCDITKLRELYAMKKEYEADEARKAFVAAMSAFKSHAIVVSKDKDNLQYKSKYTSLGNLVSTVTPYLSQHNLSVRWDIDQTNGIKVTCIITHAQGHAESVAMVCPPDKSGAKNPIQEIKSAITYAKACTFESICGLASTEANLDDDGNGYQNQCDITEELEWIANACSVDELKRLYTAAYKKAQNAKDTRAMQQVIAAKNERLKELQ